MNWKELWMTLFGTTEWLGLNMGFWVALAAVLLIVILMNVLFWSMKPKTENKNCPNKKIWSYVAIVVLPILEATLLAVSTC